MANWYVYSGAAGTASGADWTNAKTTIAAAASAAAASDDIWVADDHAESSASAITISIAGGFTTANRVLCVRRTGGSVPPVAADLRATATVTTTGANGITITPQAYVYGIIFNCGTGASAANITLTSGAGAVLYENCAFNLVTTSTSSRINIGSNGSAFTEWNNCTCSFGSTGQQFSPTLGGATFRWRNTPGTSAVTGATIPTALYISNDHGETVFDGLDLSALGSGKTISTTSSGKVKLINCKLGASVTVSSTPTSNAFPGLDLVGCSSGSNVRRDERYLYQGTLTTETTIIRTAGASDGTTAFSWKVVTTSNCRRLFPFETFEGAIWNDTTGSSKTLTVHCVTDNVTLQDADIWIEVEYLGDASYPVTTLITDANATVLTTAANQTTSTETWTTTGLVTPVKQKLDVTFTPQMKGPIRWKVKVAKASTTVYVCPKAELS